MDNWNHNNRSDGGWRCRGALEEEKTVNLAFYIRVCYDESAWVVNLLFYFIDAGRAHERSSKMRQAAAINEESIYGNKKYKDRLFRFVFGAKENRKYLLSLYNAVNNSDYTDEEELEITTLEDILYVTMKNDLSFILDSEMNLYEHQSSYNPNMPVRGLLYMAQLFQKWLGGKNIYDSRLLKLPTPQYVVFYNGKKNIPDKQYLYLSDAFEVPVQDGAYEWTAVMYNINEGHNQELMDSCRALKDYASYVSMVREGYEQAHNLRKAIDYALEQAVSRNYLDGFFKNYKEEVFMTTLTEFDMEQYEEGLRTEGFEIGHEEGREEERFANKVKLVRHIRRQSSKGHTIEEMAEFYDLQNDYVKTVIDMIAGIPYETDEEIAKKLADL